MTLTIRRAELRDSEGIWKMHVASIRQLCRSHYTPEEIAAWSARPKPERYGEMIVTREVLVACEGEEVVGFGQLNPATAELEALYVAPWAAGAGVGRRLVAEMEAIAVRHGVRSLKLRASLNAVPFYTKMGFLRVTDSFHRLTDTVSVRCVDMEKTLA